jgi:hypothetical protein
LFVNPASGVKSWNWTVLDRSAVVACLPGCGLRGAFDGDALPSWLKAVCTPQDARITPENGTFCSYRTAAS